MAQLFEELIAFRFSCNLTIAAVLYNINLCRFRIMPAQYFVVTIIVNTINTFVIILSVLLIIEPVVFVT